MASADDGLSAPGSATYNSDTMTVGDGTWDFTKNTFLLPNLVGLNFDTMMYNGMGNRFSTLAQYHSLITAHGIFAAITFLFIVPAAVMIVRFYRGREGAAVRTHIYLQILTVGFSTVVFVLGYFAVGPNRSLTNPHHGIGVAIYTLVLTQAIGGFMVRTIRKRSLRIMIHQWFGRATALLGIIQVPLGLTLYGSPKFTFILYAVWMGLLLILYFILSWRREMYHDDLTIHGGRSEAGLTESDIRSRSGRTNWLAPLAAGAGAFALFRGRKQPRDDQSKSSTTSQSRSRGPPEVVPSRGHSSYLGDEKYSERTDRTSGGGLMDKLLTVAGLLGAGAFAKRMKDRRDKERYYDEEYSAVETDTPSRYTGPGRSRGSRKHDDYTESEFTEDRTDIHRRTPLLSESANPAATAALSASGPRPVTPRASRPANSRYDSHEVSEYSSYVSPSRRTRADEEDGGLKKGLLAGLGLNWFTRKMKERRDKRAEDERMRMEDQRRDDRHSSRYTEDSSYMTPTKSSSRPRPAPRPAPTVTTVTQDSESSMIESRPTGTGIGGPPMPPFSAGNAPPQSPQSPLVPIAHPRAGSRSRHNTATGSVDMPPMPPDPHGVLHQETGSESYISAAAGRPQRRDSSRRRRASERAAAAAAANAAGLAAEEGTQWQRDQSRNRSRSRPPLSGPVSVKVKYHDDKDRNVTLRRLTDEEAKRERRNRRRSASASSLSGSEGPSRRRYRRDSSAHRSVGESTVEPMSPPSPAFAGGRPAGKDSAYYSGQAGPSGVPVAAPTVSSIESHGTWSALSPSPPSKPPAPASEPVESSLTASVSAAERRRRRRQERGSRPPTSTIEQS
ncbi:hypothetical protein F4809DRAFT_309663 [Biscogniauxia mediterranea]|nr:hypothetical protein F4809DRAFT_309663 [Biscogniauxia mediterranea]